MRSYLHIAGLSIFLAGCGSDYQAESVKTEWFDRVCIDYNLNSRCEEAELTEPRSIDGFKSTDTRLKETVDSVTGEQILVLKAPGNSERVDALTTLLWYELAYNPLVAGDLDSAKQSVSTRFGVIWPTGDSVNEAYALQESEARKQFADAQALYPAESAIIAVAESMFINGALDSSADAGFIQSFSGVAGLSAQAITDNAVEAWYYQSNQGRLVTVTNDNSIGIWGFDASKNFTQLSHGELVGGEETPSAVASTESRQQNTLTGKSAITTTDEGVALDDSAPIMVALPDAYAGATTQTPAPAPAPPPPPSPTPGGGSGDGGGQSETRLLTPRGTIQKIRLGSDFRSGFALTNDEAITDPAFRACVSSIYSYGVFKFDSYISNDVFPSVSACNQSSLSDFEISDDGAVLLVADDVAQRVYWVDSQTMREKSAYYLQLSDAINLMRLNPAAEYFVVNEKGSDAVYIVRISDMQVMSTATLSNGAQLQDARWLDEGKQLLLMANNEWQLWDTRLPYKANQLEVASHNWAGHLQISTDGLSASQILDQTLSVYRLSDGKKIMSLTDVDDMQWNGAQILAKQGEAIRQYVIHSHVNSDLQVASLTLTPSFVAGLNPSLSAVSKKLNLIKTIEGTNLQITWSGTLATINYQDSSQDNNDQGSVTQLTQAQQGTITATINGYFRGTAVRWTRDFSIVIQEK